MSTQPNAIKQSSVPGLAIGDYSDQTPGAPSGPRAVSAVINALPWEPATEYVANQLVTNSGTTYICAVPNLSGGDFGDDLDLGYWTAIGTVGGSTGFPYQTFNGSPVGVVTPTAPGVLGLDTGSNGLYFATGATDADWVQVTGTAVASPAGMSATPGGVTINGTDSGAPSVNLNGTDVDLTADAGGSVTLIGGGGYGVVVTDDGAGHAEVGFFGATPAVQAVITGSLSTVIDPAAQAVLTSIIAALTALGLATDGTT